MIYKHKYFTLDDRARKVFDENNKELSLTGNAFRVLVFLCANDSATITDIGDYLDSSKDYDENHIRQYRYKIKSIIGNNIVEYKNGIYSLVGHIKKLEKIEENDRNTDLLREDSVQLKNKNKLVEKLTNLKFSKVPAIIAITALLLTFIDWHSYGYYTLMKFTVMGTAAYYAYYVYEAAKKQDFWFWGLVVIAILFNPIIPIHLGNKSLWMIIDVAVIGFLIGLIINFKKYDK